MMREKRNSIVDYKQVSPGNIDIKMAEAKRLASSETVNDLYCLLEGLYREYLEQYINKKGNLFSYDQQILESPLNFKQVKSTEKDFYQFSSNMHYFYIRNTLFIERLSIDDLNLLIAKYNSGVTLLDDDIIELLERTYPKVIVPFVSNTQMAGDYTNYGPLSDGYFAPVNALVIGFRYDMYEEETDQKDDDIWFDTYAKQREFLQAFLPVISETLNTHFAVPCTIIEYDDDSVKKKDNGVVHEKTM